MFPTTYPSDEQRSGEKWRTSIIAPSYNNLYYGGLYRYGISTALVLGFFEGENGVMMAKISPVIRNIHGVFIHGNDSELRFAIVPSSDLGSKVRIGVMKIENHGQNKFQFNFGIRDFKRT